MSVSPRAFPEYRPTHIEWLDACPSHWHDSRIKFHFREKNARRGHSNIPLLSLTRQRGLIPQANTTGKMPSAEDLSNYKVCEPGDLVMNRMQAWSGMFAAATIEGVVSPDYSVFEIKSGNVSFFESLFRSPRLVEQFALASKGIGTGFNRLYTPEFGAIRIPVPPACDQKAIVRFIRHLDRRVNQLITSKRRLIALLNEQKQCIIHRAVTQGLDPTVPLKPSGIEWLGNIPQHWEVRRLKNVASQIVDCLHATPRYSDSGSYPAIRTADISPGIVHVSKAKKIASADYARWTARLEPREGDILYSREGERLGIAACVPAGTKLCISQRMMVFRIAEEHYPHFVMNLLNSQSTYGQALQDVMGATAPHVNISTIRNYALALPPTKQEQERVVSHITSEIKPIDITISRLEREIDLIREYRTRLVSDVVTGQLDVRHLDLPEMDDEAAVMGYEGDDIDELDGEELPEDDELAEAAL